MYTNIRGTHPYGIPLSRICVSSYIERTMTHWNIYCVYGFTSMWNISRYYFTHTIMPNAFRFPIPFDKPIKLRDLCVPMPECVIVCVCMRILHQYNECTIATHAFRWLTQGNRYVSQGEYT